LNFRQRSAGERLDDKVDSTAPAQHPEDERLQQGTVSLAGKEVLLPEVRQGRIEGLPALVYCSQNLQCHAPHELRVIGSDMGGRLKSIHWNIGVQGIRFKANAYRQTAETEKLKAGKKFS
jgi:hypothetical protein